MELTVKQYADRLGRNKAYLSRIVREAADNKDFRLLPGVTKIEKKVDTFGTIYYSLTVEKKLKK